MSPVIKTETWPLHLIIPYAKNARKIPQAAIDAVALSLRTFGWQQPLVVDRAGVIVVGHVRRLAALQNGSVEAPVVVFQGTPEQARQYRLMDNRSHDEAKWDEDILTAELLDMRGLELDLSLTGFTERELAGYLGPEGGLTDPDDVPPVPDAPVSVLGDLWLLGRHRVLCGDSTEASAVARLMDGAKADMVFTDPPYNADYSSRVDKVRPKPWGGILNDAMSPEEYSAFLSEVFSVLLSGAAEAASIYCCIDWKRYPLLADLFAQAFTHKATIVWDKQHFGLGTYYRTQYELILFGVNGERPATWHSGRDERDVWSVRRDVTSAYAHPTQKPVEISERAITNSSKRDDAVIDLFGGSGSTLIACEKTGRNCRMMELAPQYVDVIVNRWQAFTGQKATLDGCGATFDHVRDGRRQQAEDALREEALACQK